MEELFGSVQETSAQLTDTEEFPTENGADMDGFDMDDFEAGLFGEENTEPEGGVGDQRTAAEQTEGENEPEGGDQTDGHANEESGEQPPEGGEMQQAEPETMLNWKDQRVALPTQAVRTLSGALGQDAITLLQKGLNYESKASRELALLNDYARLAGRSLPDYLDYIESELVNGEIDREVETIRDRYPMGTPDEALRDIARVSVEQRRTQERQMRRIAAEQASAREQQAGEERMRESVMQDIRRFRQQHPEIESSADVPQEVWDQVNEGVSLTAAYAVYERDAAQAENARLREQMTAMQQNRANRAASPGAMSSAGDSDSFMKDFMEAFR